MQNFLFSSFDSSKATLCNGYISLQQVVEKVIGERLRAKTNSCRESYEKEKGAKELLESLKDRADNDPKKCEVEKTIKTMANRYAEEKKTLPMITVHAYFENGGRKNSDPHTFTNLMLADIDKITKDELKQLKERAKQYPYIVFACESVSGAGFHMLIAVEVKEGITDENFKDVFDATMNRVDRDLGVETDRSCNNINRCMFLNHDPEAFFNPDAQTMDVTGDMWLNKNELPIFNFDQDMDKKERLSNYLDVADENLKWVRGNRHNTLVSLAATLNRNGFDKELVKDECCRRHEEPDFNSEEICDTVDDIYNRYKGEHGADEKQKDAKRDKRTKGQTARNVGEETGEVLWEDEEERLDIPAPDATTLRPYFIDGLFDYIVKTYDSPEVQFTSALALLTVAGAMMDNVSCLYRGKRRHPYIFMSVIGVAASGKGCINKAEELFWLHADRLQSESQRVKEEGERERTQWKECVKKCETGDCGCGSEPPVIEVLQPRLMLTISQSRLIKQLAVNNNVPTLIYAPEMDFKWDMKEMPLSTTLRAVFENEPIGSHTFAHGDMNIKHPKGSLLIAGTPQQAVRFFGNKEDGLVSRFLTFFLPRAPYVSLGVSQEDYVSAKEAAEKRMLTFASYASTHELILYLTQGDINILDDFFMKAELRYAKYSGDAVYSFIRRLQDIDIRIAMVLTVFDLYKENRIQGTYPIPQEIISLIVSWNDYFIQQHIRLLNRLPEVENPGSGTESKYAAVYDTLPCGFALSEAAVAFQKVAGVSEKTAARTLKKWVKEGLLKKELQRYTKIECLEKENPDTVRA